jgi:hypothetical protein
MDGVVDFLCDCTHEQRKSLVTFTDAFSAWIDEKEKAKASKSATYPLNEVRAPHMVDFGALGRKTDRRWGFRL